MSRWTALLLAIAWALPSAAGERFVSVDVFIDSEQALAAWQFVFTSDGGPMQVVGVENGQSDVFGAAPYYDRETTNLGRVDRIVVADYSLAERTVLPSGHIRITTLHLMLPEGSAADFESRLIVAAGHDGNEIDARISFELSTGREQ